MSKDLTVEAFLSLYGVFFHDDGSPRPFTLRLKENTQDDPLDTFIIDRLSERLTPGGIRVLGAESPLISPDLALKDAALDKTKQSAVLDLSKIVGIEVKKLQRTGGQIARLSGLDYNSTPPCGTIRVYAENKKEINIRGFYLFVCQEPDASGTQSVLSALALADGNFLNEDFDYYLKVTGVRNKATDLGTFKDGADRQRPMVIFSNPLSVRQLDGFATLIHPAADLHDHYPALRRVGKITRTVPGTKPPQGREYYCYRVSPMRGGEGWDLTDPLAKPQRKQATQQRGRFTVDIVAE